MTDPQHSVQDQEWLREGHVDCVSCPVCAFTFDACHEDQGGGYSCPLCAEARLVEQLEAVRGELETTRADLYQCKREREILSRNLSAFTGNA